MIYSVFLHFFESKYRLNLLKIDSLKTNRIKVMNLEQNLKTLENQDEWILGVKGLARFLGVSHVTAGKIKDQVPFYRFSRTFRFKKDEVLAALAKNHQTV